MLAHALMTHHHEWANTTTANGGEGESGRPRRLLFVDGTVPSLGF